MLQNAILGQAGEERRGRSMNDIFINGVAMVSVVGEGEDRRGPLRLVKKSLLKSKKKRPEPKIGFDWQERKKQVSPTPTPTISNPMVIYYYSHCALYQPTNPLLLLQIEMKHLFRVPHLYLHKSISRLSIK